MEHRERHAGKRGEGEGLELARVNGGRVKLREWSPEQQSVQGTKRLHEGQVAVSASIGRWIAQPVVAGIPVLQNGWWVRAKPVEVHEPPQTPPMVRVAVGDNHELHRAVDDVALQNVVAQHGRAVAAVDDDLAVADVNDGGVAGAHIKEVDGEWGCQRRPRSEGREARRPRDGSTPY